MRSFLAPRLSIGIVSLFLLANLLLGEPTKTQEPAKLSVLLLGDKGHHRPADFAKLLTPVFAKVGIDVTYTDKVEDLTAENLAKYDTVAIFRDSGDLPAKNETALVDFIE